MMSYQDCQPLFKYHKDELIALFVETLTGTTFEMTVSPYDTIMSIKNKIQRVEGIPVSQQHLLYNLHELEDSAALIDYSITNGSTIKLVLSMRGGPISTVRRILPLDDITWKELVDFNRDDLLDDLPPGCRMAVLVFREGDQLNMFRVLENVDGSYSPLSESWSGSSIRNLFEDEDSDETAKQRLEENTVTMEKMNDLKNRLEELAIQRKNQKFSYRNTYDEVPCVSGYSPSESKKECRGKSKLVSGNKRANFVHLPPLAIDDKDLSSDLDPEERIRKTRTAEFSRVPVLPDITPSPPSIAVFDSNVDSVDLPRPKTSPDRLTGHRICEILSEAGRHRLLGAHHCSTSPLHSLPPVPSDDNNNFELDWCSSRRLSSAKPLDKPSTSASLFRSSNSSVFTKKLSATPAVNPFSFFQSSNSNSSSGGNTVSSLFSSTTKVRKLPVRSISSKRNSTPSTIEGKSNKTTSSPFQSMAKSSGQLDPFEATPKYLDIPLANANKQLPSLSSETCKNLTNCNLSSASHKESIQCNKKTPSNSSKVSENVNTGTSDNSSATSGSNNGNKVIKKNKKEPRSRCGKCNKRLTLTNTYTCRCGHIFCANHRYSEAHECTYDYKSEGRKILEKNNPLISAPKLPKI